MTSTMGGRPLQNSEPKTKHVASHPFLSVGEKTSDGCTHTNITLLEIPKKALYSEYLWVHPLAP